MSKSWRTVSVERSRPEEAHNHPDKYTCPGGSHNRRLTPDARANAQCQRGTVRVCGEQTAACTTLQSQVAFKRARRATVRGAGGLARHKGRRVDWLVLWRNAACKCFAFPTKSNCSLSNHRVEASGAWNYCRSKVTSHQVSWKAMYLQFPTLRWAGEGHRSSRTRCEGAKGLCIVVCAGFLHHGRLHAVLAVPSNWSSSRHIIALMLAPPAATCGYGSPPLSTSDDTGCVCRAAAGF